MDETGIRPLRKKNEKSRKVSDKLRRRRNAEIKGPKHTTRAKFGPKINPNVSDKLRRRRNSEKRAQAHDEREI